VKTYADIGQAMYEDALARARVLQKALRALADAPSEATLKAARESWLSAREPYMQTEVFRFGNSVVDEWEGKVNAWPLDEGLIDYVEGQYGTESDSNPYYTANVIANKRLKVGAKTLDATSITKKLLRELHEIGGVEANVATGYHAIEFLLWGQDLNGTGPGAGNRPASDYLQGAGATGCVAPARMDLVKSRPWFRHGVGVGILARSVRQKCWRFVTHTSERNGLRMRPHHRVRSTGCTRMPPMSVIRNIRRCR